MGHTETVDPLNPRADYTVTKERDRENERLIEKDEVGVSSSLERDAHSTKGSQPTAISMGSHTK